MTIKVLLGIKPYRLSVSEGSDPVVCTFRNQEQGTENDNKITNLLLILFLILFLILYVTNLNLFLPESVTLVTLDNRVRRVITLHRILVLVLVVVGVVEKPPIKYHYCQ